MSTKTKATGTMVKITLTAGLVGKRNDQKRVVRALGLGKFGSSIVHADTPTIRGMLNTVPHLVSVAPAETAAAAPAKKKPAAKAKAAAE